MNSFSYLSFSFFEVFYMKITEDLRAVIPDHCAAIATMFGITGDDYHHQANHLYTHKELKEWFKPIALILKHEHKIRLSFRSHANLAHPEELESFSLIFFSAKMAELFRIEVTEKDISLSCPGICLSRRNDAATRFDDYTLLCHIKNRSVPAEFFDQVLFGFGKPAGIRAEKTWRLVLALMQEVLDELSPQRAAFKENMSAYYQFLNAAYGGYSKVQQRTQFGVRVSYASNGQQRHITDMLSYCDDMLLLEVLEEGLIIELGFASLTPGSSRFSASEMARTIAGSDDPTLFRQQLQRVVCALHVLTRAYPRAEKTRRDILLTMNVGVRRMEVAGDSSDN